MILRGVLLNLLVWMPLAIALMAALMVASGQVSKWIPGLEYICGVVPRCCVDLAYLCGPQGGYGLQWLLWPAACVGGVFVALSAFYSLGTRIPGDSSRYKLRRCYERGIRWVLFFGGFFLVIGSQPLVSSALVDAASVLLGLGGGSWAFLRSRSNSDGKVPLGLLAPVASAMLLYGLLLVSYELASFVVRPDTISLRIRPESPLRRPAPGSASAHPAPRGPGSSESPV